MNKFAISVLCFLAVNIADKAEVRAQIQTPGAGVVQTSTETGFQTLWNAEDSQTLAPDAQANWTLPPLPTMTGKIAALRFEAERQTSASVWNPQLAWTLNGKALGAIVGNASVGLPRLIGGGTGEQWLDISDLVVSPAGGAVNENRLVLKNEFGAPLTIKSLAAGYVSLAVAESTPARNAFARRDKFLSGPKLEAANFAVRLTPGGGLVIENSGSTHAVESNFSYPFMRDDNWNRLAVANTPANGGEWKWSATKENDEFQIRGVGKHYRLQRKVSLKTDHVLIADTFTNTSNEDVAIAFDNKVTPLQPPRAINVSGVYKKTYFPYSAQVPASNPTIFFDGGNSGMGMVALDDFYRLQFALKQQGRTGFFENRSFGLPAGDSYTFEWALYPTASGDYYEFINAVRRDHVPPTRIEGGVAFLPSNAPLRWPREKMAQWLRDRSAKIVIFSGPYSGAPWLGGYAQYMSNMPVPFDEAMFLAELKKAREVLKSIDPEIKCLAPFETALTPDQPPGESTPLFPDSIAVGEDGAPQGYKFPAREAARKEFIATKGHSYIYYPTGENSYYRSMRGIIEKALNETEVDGIYFDIFSYTAPEFRWTYDRWDNRSVDIDLSNYTIKRKKADLEKLSEDARADIVQMVLNRKSGNVVIANYMPVVSKIRALPIMHFKETLMDYGYMLSHFSTPIMLGWTPGYSPGAKSIGKEGDWWQEWKTDADFFADIKDKLQSGNLYFTYWAPPGRMFHSNLTRPTILERMFPITVQKIGAGIIEGKERIITLHSGEYSWGDNAAAKAYFYDGEGKEFNAEMQTQRSASGANVFKVQVPAGGAVVIEKL